MKSTDYIINELETFIQKFPRMRIRYEYNEEATVHIIEVVPKEIYHLNKEYINWESTMFDKFITHYPYENICFISEDDSYGIENEIFVKEGLEYAPISIKEESITFDVLFKVIEQIILNGAFIVDKNNCFVNEQQEIQKCSHINYLLAA